MTREEKIKLLQSVKDGKVKLKQLKQQKMYRFDRIGESLSYIDSLSGVVMSLEQINALPQAVNPMHIGRMDFVGRTGEHPWHITIVPEFFIPESKNPMELLV